MRAVEHLVQLVWYTDHHPDMQAQVRGSSSGSGSRNNKIFLQGGIVAAAAPIALT